METKIGVGKSNDNDPFKAGSTAAKEALSNAGIEECDFVFLFSTVGYNQDELLKGVRSVTKDTPLSGCSGEGIITQDGPEGEVIFALSGTDIEKDVAGVMLISSDEMSFTNYLGTGLKENSFTVGEGIAKSVNADMPSNPILLFLLF